MPPRKKTAYPTVFNLSLDAGVYAIRTNDGTPFLIGDDETPTRGSRLVVAADSDIDFHLHENAKLTIRSVRISDPVDPVPHEALLTSPQPLTLQEQIARFLGAALEERDRQGNDTWEEADDFEIDDDDVYLPLSGYELPDGDYEEPVEAPEKPPAAPESAPEQVPSPPSENAT